MRQQVTEFLRRLIGSPQAMSECSHKEMVKAVTPSSDGCVDCQKMGQPWVHLRLCLTCGYVGCCDNSPNKHATAHFHASEHPVIMSFEPDEDWLWCYVDEALMFPD